MSAQSLPLSSCLSAPRWKCGAKDLLPSQLLARHSLRARACARERVCALGLNFSCQWLPHVFVFTHLRLWPPAALPGFGGR